MSDADPGQPADPEFPDSTEPPLCPRCGRSFGPTERFCPDDGMPLVRAGDGESSAVDPNHEAARKIRPQYARGELIKIAMAANQAESELIQGMLLEEGIPSVERRTRGFDVPDFLAAGPRDIMVAETALDAARDLLREADIRAGEEPRDHGYEAPVELRPVRVFAALLVALLIGATIALVIYALGS